MTKAQENAAVTVSGTLEFGVIVDGAVHRNFVMRTSSLNDVYRAAETVSLPEALQTDQAAKLAYQLAFDDAQVLGQLVELGDLGTVPSPAALVNLIDPDDMAILRAAAMDVKKKFQLSRNNLPLSEPLKSDLSASASI